MLLELVFTTGGAGVAGVKELVDSPDVVVSIGFGDSSGALETAEALEVELSVIFE